MIIQDQTAVIDFLSGPSTHGGAAVQRIDTHASVVFLTGARAYKLKRAVRFDYLDFSTCERRRALCEAEVRLNRRTAPSLYRGVVPVTRQADGSYAIAGAGTPVDWLVEMNRFPQEALFDRLASAGRLGLALMSPLAAAIADFHLSAERRSDHGGKAGMAWVIDGNAAGLAEFGRGCLEPAAVRRMTDDAFLELDRRATILERRREAGFVRQCHGDLHLRNIVLLDGRPTLFDGVEFNDEISCTDVLYDLAFLLMDLWRRRLPRHANIVWNRYLTETADFEGVPLLRLFLSCRAAVRAKTSAASAQLQDHAQRRGELHASAREYLAMAEHLLRPPGPCLVAIGGLSGSGKSTLALSLAPSVGPVPGAIVLRSDETRKRLSGVPMLARLGPEGYRPEVSERVYATLAERAALILRGGHSVLVDAVYAQPADREVIERAASTSSVPFIGFWLDAPEPTLLARTSQRHNDPSDADADVVRMQRARDAGPITWDRLDASLPAALVLSAALHRVRARRPLLDAAHDPSHERAASVRGGRHDDAENEHLEAGDPPAVDRDHGAGGTDEEERRQGHEH
jgi:aminoglycoside phosphotransferase family enzyme/predicted kinase